MNPNEKKKTVRRIACRIATPLFIYTARPAPPVRRPRQSAPPASAASGPTTRKVSPYQSGSLPVIVIIRNDDHHNSSQYNVCSGANPRGEISTDHHRCKTNDEAHDRVDRCIGFKQFRDGHCAGKLERPSSYVGTDSNAQRQQRTSASNGTPYDSRNGSKDLTPIPTGNHLGCDRSSTKFVLFEQVAQYRVPVSVRQNTFKEPGGQA